MNKLELSADFLSSYNKSRKDDIINALKLFRDGRKYIVASKKKTTTHVVVSKAEKKLLECLIELVNSGLLIALPEKLTEMINEVNKLKFDKNRKFYKQTLSQIFDYEKFKIDEAWSWSKSGNNKIKRNSIKNVKGRSEYLDELKIDCCPYCNRSYIMKGDIKVKPNPQKKRYAKTINPALDHYWSKSDYPYLAICLHNLIPSCNLCNSIIKRTNELHPEHHIHPYTHSFHKKIKFIVVPDNVKAFNYSPDDFSIEIQEKQYKDSKKAKEYADFFGLEDLYNNHKDYAAEILVKKQAYNEAWLAGVNSIEGLNMDPNVAKRYYFGNYLNEKEINKRPLSKLTIDLLEGDL